MNDTKTLAVNQEAEHILPAIVMPAVSPAEAVAAWKQYEQLKKSIAVDSDIQSIQGRDFYKKSYWRKIATFFNLSVEIVDEKHEEIAEGNIFWSFTCKATAPNGRYAIGTGSCDQMEKGRKNSLHNTRASAETRAFNRAVSNLVGGGEVSAEEVGNDAIDPTDSFGHIKSGSATKTAQVASTTCSVCHAPAGKKHATSCTNS
jgi:hypothetical protein